MRLGLELRLAHVIIVEHARYLLLKRLTIAHLQHHLARLTTIRGRACHVVRVTVILSTLLLQGRILTQRSVTHGVDDLPRLLPVDSFGHLLQVG